MRILKKSVIISFFEVYPVFQYEAGMTSRRGTACRALTVIIGLDPIIHL
jgi:hypothetical protein